MKKNHFLILERDENLLWEIIVIHLKSVKSENNSYSIPKGKIGFARGLVPFVAGVLGTLIIVGGCISIPSIRETISEKLLSDSSKSESSTKSNDESSVESVINKVVSSSSDKAVSVEDYSNTSIAVANKVLPSVVGITVTYSVNSLIIHIMECLKELLLSRFWCCNN